MDIDGCHPKTGLPLTQAPKRDEDEPTSISCSP